MNRPEPDIAPGAPPSEKHVDSRAVLGFAVLLVGSFLAFLDIQIIASALGHLSASLGATLEEVAWAQSAYLIAEIVVIPLTGWLTQALSTRYLFVLAMSGFALSSLLCAIAWSLPALVAFRVLQGIFGGMLIPMVFTSVFLIFPPKHQPLATTLGGAVSLLAPVMGPIIGGYIVNYTSWHWLFLLNLPFAIPAIILGYFFIGHDQPDFPRLKRFDFPGTLALITFLGCGDFVLKEGIRFDWFSSGLIKSMTLTSVLAFAFFLWWELRCPNPVVALRLYWNRSFALSCGVAFVHGINIYAPMFLVPAILTSIAQYDSIST